MKDVFSLLQTVIAGIGAFVGWFLGGMDGFLYALVVIVTLDYISGYESFRVMKSNKKNPYKHNVRGINTFHNTTPSLALSADYFSKFGHTISQRINLHLNC